MHLCLLFGDPCPSCTNVLTCGQRTCSEWLIVDVSDVSMRVSKQEICRIPELLSLEEVARLFRVSKTTVYRMASHRLIPFYKVGGALRFSQDEMLAYLESQRVGSGDEWL